jgi:hypothetical protein
VLTSSIAFQMPFTHMPFASESHCACSLLCDSHLHMIALQLTSCQEQLEAIGMLITIYTITVARTLMQSAVSGRISSFSASSPIRDCSRAVFLSQLRELVMLNMRPMMPADRVAGESE